MYGCWICKGRSLSARTMQVNDLSARTMQVNDLSARTMQVNDLSARTMQVNDLSARTMQVNDLTAEIHMPFYFYAHHNFTWQPKRVGLKPPNLPP